MPSIASSAKVKSQQFIALDATRQALGETNDCGVKCVAVATGADYLDVHNRISALGRKKGKGTTLPIINKVLSDLGFTMTQIPQRSIIRGYPGVHKNLQSITTHHPARFAKAWPKGTFILLVSGGRHILTVKDGVNHDWTVGKPKKVNLIWHIEKK